MVVRNSVILPAVLAPLQSQCIRLESYQEFLRFTTMVHLQSLASQEVRLALAYLQLLALLTPSKCTDHCFLLDS